MSPTCPRAGARTERGDPCACVASRSASRCWWSSASWRRSSRRLGAGRPSSPSRPPARRPSPRPNSRSRKPARRPSRRRGRTRHPRPRRRSRRGPQRQARRRPARTPRWCPALTTTPDSSPTALDGDATLNWDPGTADHGVGRCHDRARVVAVPNGGATRIPGGSSRALQRERSRLASLAHGADARHLSGEVLEVRCGTTALWSTIPAATLGAPLVAARPRLHACRDAVLG